MRRSPLILALTVLGVLGATCSSTPDPYAAYRQVESELIPGSFDWEVQPVDPDYRATISPQDAYATIYAAGRRPNTTAILGQVYNQVEHTTGPPAWIFVTDHTCFATAKGDLVSPGRSGDGCTDENLYIQGVDATSGRSLGGITGYEPPEGWTPARAGTPDVVTATTSLGTTRLH